MTEICNWDGSAYPTPVDVVATAEISGDGLDVAVTISHTYGLKINWGDGITNSDLTHRYHKNGNYRITIQVFCGSGYIDISLIKGLPYCSYGSYGGVLHSDLLPPYVSIYDIQYDGATLSFVVYASLYTSLVIDYGDGLIEPLDIVAPIYSKTIEVSHTYPATGWYTIKVTATNGVGDFTAEEDVDIEVP